MYAMRKSYTFILMIGLFASCFSKKTDNKLTTYQQDFYAMLNDLIRIKLLNTSVIKVQTRPVTKTMWKKIVTPWKTNLSNNETILSATGTYGIRAETLLNSAEIRYMYASIDNTKKDAD